MTKTNEDQTSHAGRSEVAAEPLVGVGYDYADAFEIELAELEARSPEQLFRAALDNASWVQRWVPIVHRHLLRFRLGPHPSSEHILGWRIVNSGGDVIQLQADGPLIRGVIVGRRMGRSAVFTTFVFYVRRLPARVIWAVTGPLHRRIAPYLLERGAHGPPGPARTSQ